MTMATRISELGEESISEMIIWLRIQEKASCLKICSAIYIDCITISRPWHEDSCDAVARRRLMSIEK